MHIGMPKELLILNTQSLYTFCRIQHFNAPTRFTPAKLLQVERKLNLILLIVMMHQFYIFCIIYYAKCRSIIKSDKLCWRGRHCCYWHLFVIFVAYQKMCVYFKIRQTNSMTHQPLKILCCIQNGLFFMALSNQMK